MLVDRGHRRRGAVFWDYTRKQSLHVFRTGVGRDSANMYCDADKLLEKQIYRNSD